MRLHSGVLLLLTVAVATGCGPGSGGPCAVAGRVTLHRQPLDQGTIEFHDSAGARGQITALIADGQYALPQVQGLPPGRYLVRIHAPDTRPGQTHAMVGSYPVNRDRVPASFNQSERTVEVTPGGRNRFDFEIE